MRILSALILLVSINSNASEVRMLEALPTSGKTTAQALIKAKKPGFLCQYVKIGDSGNPNKVKSSKTYWFEVSAVSDKENNATQLLADGKKAVRCTLKEYNEEKSRMANADLDGEDAE